MKEQKSGPIIVAIVAIPLILFGAYMGTYYALLRGNAEDGNLFGPAPWRIPLYQIESDYIEGFIRPAHQIDRLIRLS